jgi:hypothetical protein
MGRSFGVWRGLFGDDTPRRKDGIYAGAVLVLPCTPLAVRAELVEALHLGFDKLSLNGY